MAPNLPLLATCPVAACFPNLLLWLSHCLPPKIWRRTGTFEGSSYWLNKSPCGMLCASVTQFFIYGACYITNRLIIVPMFGFSTIGIFLLLFYNLLLFMASLSHYRTMTTDPGAVPRKAEPLPRDSNKFKRIGRPLPKCRRTGVYKPPRAHFDRQIQRNVVRMDHHCPWVNNCVGLGNQKLFLLFLLYISLSCWLSLGLVLTLFVRCGQSSSRMALKIMAKSGMPRAPRHTELATQEMLEYQIRQRSIACRRKHSGRQILSSRTWRR
eukprot:jgi/Bigna1/91897/estExt_fgenesh1_pg.C_1280025